MCAFLTNPSTLPLRTRSRAALCHRRPLTDRPNAHIQVSALTDEIRPLDKPQPTNEITPPVRPSPAQPGPPSFNQRPDRPLRPGRRDNRRDNSTAPPPFVPDPKASYYTKCANCQAAYQVDPSELGRGKKVACAVCANEWFQRPDRLLVLKEVEGFKTYPMEKKDDLITQSRTARRDRHQNTRRDYRDNRDNRDYRDNRDNRDYRDNRDRRAPRQRARFSIFIGNLPFAVQEDELAQLIKSKVNALRVSIVKDPTGRSKGFAFADVSSEQEVQTAVDQLDGAELGGRSIAVRAGRKNN